MPNLVDLATPIRQVYYAANTRIPRKAGKDLSALALSVPSPPPPHLHLPAPHQAIRRCVAGRTVMSAPDRKSLLHRPKIADSLGHKVSFSGSSKSSDERSSSPSPGTPRSIPTSPKTKPQRPSVQRIWSHDSRRWQRIDRNNELLWK
ncbi:hypothetical protein MMC20_006368 [Loxospora ochrophaea]|nr:hypothetical protein [Loxospora ochrophaea]